MENTLMSLKVLLPFKVFAEIKNVKRIVAETSEGSFGFLPQRLDCVAALTPGIFTYEREGEEEKYLAVNEGILVKTGLQVLVSVRNAIGDAPLGKLKELVETDMKQQNEEQINMRSVMAKLERGFIRNFEKTQKS